MKCLKMTFQCRTCANVIYNMNAKNLFESENFEILMNIKTVVGTALISSPDLPSHICACCLLDLKQAVFHMEVFRERCLRTQEELLSTHMRTEELSSDGESELGHQSNSCDANVKQEIDINYEESTIKSHDFCDVEDALIEFEEEKSILTVVAGNCVEDTTEDAESLVASVKNEIRSICVYSSDSQETIAELQASDSDCSQNADSYKDASLKAINPSDFTNVLIKANKRTSAKRKTLKKNSSSSNLNSVSCSSLKVKKNYTSWKNLTEEQIIDRRRKQRQRDCICEKCGRHFTDQSNFKLHMLRHTGIKNFKCKECGKLFYTDHLLQLHERTVHRGERPYACKFCDKTFNSSTTRVMHERSHTNVRPYSCEYCNKTFISTSALKRHELTHNGVRAFYCNTCDKTFQRNTHLKAHLRSKLHALRETNINLLREFE